MSRCLNNSMSSSKDFEVEDMCMRGCAIESTCNQNRILPQYPSRSFFYFSQFYENFQWVVLVACSIIEPQRHKEHKGFLSWNLSSIGATDGRRSFLGVLGVLNPPKANGRFYSQTTKTQKPLTIPLLCLKYTYSLPIQRFSMNLFMVSARS